MRWRRVFIVWLGLAVLMIAHGAIREAFVTPALGPLRAHQLSSLTASLIIFAVSYFTLPWLEALGSSSLQLRIGRAWLWTTIAFEFVFGHWVFGHSWSRLLQDYNLAAGRLWLLVLVTTLLGPRLAGSVRLRELRP